MILDRTKQHVLSNICHTCDKEKLSKRILEEMWKQKVVDVIILGPSYYLSQNQGTNTSGTGDKFVNKYPVLGLYTWFPYRGPNHCSRVDKAVLLDVWLMTGEGTSFRNSSLFPTKIKSSLHRCELRLSTKQTFAVGNITQNSGSNTNITYYEGCEIRRINVITETMNKKRKFPPPAENFRLFQDKFGNFTGYVANLIFDQADIDFGALLRSEYSTSLMDVATSYQQSKWEWHV